MDNRLGWVLDLGNGREHVPRATCRWAVDIRIRAWLETGEGCGVETLPSASGHARTAVCCCQVAPCMGTSCMVILCMGANPRPPPSACNCRHAPGALQGTEATAFTPPNPSPSEPHSHPPPQPGIWGEGALALLHNG